MRSVLIVISLFFLGALHAQNEAIFDNATKSYNEGDYGKAIEYYEEILNNGEHSAELYFNLGNCYYKQNQIAPSIYYYEKALLLDPGDREIKNNLAFARQMTLDAIQPLPETGLQKIYNGAVGALTFDQWAYTAVFFILAFVVAYLLFYFLRLPSQKRAAFVSSMVALLMCFLSLLFAFFQHNNYRADQPAIVFAVESIVKSEPNARSSEAFILHEGTKVQVLESLEDYRRIELADGKTGWIADEDLRILKDF